MKAESSGKFPITKKERPYRYLDVPDKDVLHLGKLFELGESSDILPTFFLLLLGGILLENLFHVGTDCEHLLHISMYLLIFGVQFSFLS